MNERGPREIERERERERERGGGGERIAGVQNDQYSLSSSSLPIPCINITSSPSLPSLFPNVRIEYPASLRWRLEHQLLASVKELERKQMREEKWRQKRGEENMRRAMEVREEELRQKSAVVIQRGKWWQSLGPSDLRCT